METLLYSLGGFGALIIVIVVVVAIAPLKELFYYWRSVKSRRSYICPECKTTYQLEHMQASNCSVCGATLANLGEARSLTVIGSEELPVSIEDTEHTAQFSQPTSKLEENDELKP